MKGPAVSGAKQYQELCVVARNEEKCLAELQRRQQYSTSTHPRQSQFECARTIATNSPQRPATSSGDETKKCFFCKKPGHLMRDCRMRKPENAGSSRPAAIKQVTIQPI